MGSDSDLSNQAQNLYITLKDIHGKTRSIRVDKFGEIPPPDDRDYSQYTKSAMCTIRIPLHVYTR